MIFAVRKKFPLEALLRPPVEVWSGLIALFAGGLMGFVPQLFMLGREVGWICAAILVSLAMWRFLQAYSVLSYQKNLRTLPEYILHSKEIPFSHKRLFMGKGFRWTQQHTQRLRDTLRPQFRKYVEASKFNHWARRKEQEWEYVPVLKHVAKLLAQRAWWNPVAPYPPVGGTPQLHGVEPDEKDMWLDLGDRVGHTLVLGTTRVGKSRLCELLVTQDIRRGDVVILFDPKGDADLLRRMYVEAKRAGRLDDFYMFHLGYPDISARYNAIGNFSRVTEVATRIANQLPNEGNASAFREFAWRFTNIVARALVALGRRPDYQQIARHVANIESLLLDYCNVWLPTVDPDWEQTVKKIERNIKEKDLPIAMKGRTHRAIALVRYLRELDVYDPVANGLRSAFEYDKTYFDKLVASLLPLMEKLITGKTAELISPDYFDLKDSRPIFDWMQIIRKKGIIYIGLDALSDTTVAAAVGNSMFADLTSIAGQIYKFGTGHGLPEEKNKPKKMPTISLHCDEFNELIGDEFVPLLNKAGGAGVQVTAYTQTWSDVEARIGSAPKAGQIAGNFNTLVMMRVKELETAEMLTKQLPEVEIATLMAVSGVNDSSSVGDDVDFSSTNQDRVTATEVPMLAPADIVRLPKGQAFALLHGGLLYKIRLPLPDATGDELPDDLAVVASSMRKSYKASRKPNATTR